MSDEKDEEIVSYLRQKAESFSEKSIAAIERGRPLPPGGVFYFNADTIRMVTAREWVAHLSMVLRLPPQLIEIKISAEGADKCEVNVGIPEAWLRARGAKGNEIEMRSMINQMVDGAIKATGKAYEERLESRLRAYVRRRQNQAPAATGEESRS